MLIVTGKNWNIYITFLNTENDLRDIENWFLKCKLKLNFDKSFSLLHSHTTD